MNSKIEVMVSGRWIVVVLIFHAALSCSRYTNFCTDDSDCGIYEFCGPDDRCVCGVRFVPSNPCDSDVIGDSKCSHMQISYRPIGSDLVAEEWCPINSAVCRIHCDVAEEEDSILDVVCFDSKGGVPVARSASKFYRDNSNTEVTTIRFVLGYANGFTTTTRMDENGIPDGCSPLAQEHGRYGHSTTLLDDGRVLIVGGARRFAPGVYEYLTTAEIFDPSTGKHEMIVDVDGFPINMLSGTGRAFHTATLLSDGRVLVAGGVGVENDKISALDTSELFDPARKEFVELITIHHGRAHHSANMLPSGDVLLIGGADIVDGNTVRIYNDALIYNSGENKWSLADSTMNAARAYHQATLVHPVGKSGYMLVSGGENENGALKSVELFDLESSAFVDLTAINANYGRTRHCAVDMENGYIALVGGTSNSDQTGALSQVEFFHYETPEEYGRFIDESLQLRTERVDHRCAFIGADRVLVSGGVSSSGDAIDTAEVLSARPGGFFLEDTPRSYDMPRYLHSVCHLESGAIYLSGGIPDEDPYHYSISKSSLFVPYP